MNIKVNFDSIEVKEDRNNYSVKLLMLKGEKGDQGDGEDNIIEKVQVNGTDLPVTNKTVNVPVPTVDSTLSSSSTNPVQNKTIYTALSNKADTSALSNYYEISEIDGFLNNKADVSIVDKKPYYYDNVASMKADTNLKEGITTQTLGYYGVNDGGGATYKIRTKTNVDTPDDMFIIAIGDTLVAELKVDDVININQLGAKENDSTFDNTNIIETALSNVDSISLNGGIYYINSIISLSSLNNKIIDGKNSTIKGKGFASESVGNIGIFNLSSSGNIKISNLKIDGDIEWISRPYSWESGYSNYTTLRGKTYDGFCFNECENIIIENCKSMKVKVGFHFLETKNVNLNNSTSSYTMADGVLIHGGSEDIHVENHYVYSANDDQFSMVHETNDTKYVKRCSYNNCSAEGSFGACAVMQECVDCNIENCVSINNKTTPIKFGTSLGTFGCKNCYMNNINVTSNNTLLGVNNSLSNAQNNGVIVLCSTTGSSPMVNCKVTNSNFIETSGNNLSLFNPNVSNLEFYNTLFDGINLVYTDVNGSKFDNCVIKSKDTNVFTRCSFIMRNTSVTNDLTYSARGTNTIQCNGCNNVVLDDVTVSGTSTEYGNCIEFYAANSDTKNVYLNTNDKKTRLVNESDVHNNGVIVLTDIDRYSYARFREGQLVYFLSNHGLYVIGTSSWTKLNN